ncbi:MAG: indolepyruvate oxidoreductase subunit beta [Myxococcaceae bacterium]
MKSAAASTRFVVLFAGVGGQGALSAARFLGEAGHRLGLSLTVSQLHGMSQRGGAVQASVCFGTDQVASPGCAEVDVLVGLELLEALRMADRVGPRTTVLCNRLLIPPPAVSLSGAKVPTADEVLAELRKRAKALHVLDAVGLAERAGARAAVNTVMLGALVALGSSPVSAQSLLETLRATAAPSTVPVNERALSLGQGALST